MEQASAWLERIAASLGQAPPAESRYSRWDCDYDVISAMERLPCWERRLMSSSYSILTFDGLPERLGDVRDYVRRFVGDVDGVDDVVLVASELAGNAIRHTMSGRPGGSFVLELAEFKDAYHVRVTDQGDLTTPTSETAADGDEAGRGLSVVLTLARAWGVIGDHTGRAVWAEVPFPEFDGELELDEGNVLWVREELALSAELAGPTASLGWKTS